MNAKSPLLDKARGAPGDFRHGDLTRAIGNDGGQVVSRQAHPHHLALRIEIDHVTDHVQREMGYRSCSPELG